MDPITIGLLAGAAKGVLDSRANSKNQKKQDAFRKAAIAYSPWTGMGDPGAVNSGPQGLNAMLGGATQGAMIGALGGQAGLWGAQAAPAAASAGALGAEAAAPSMLGGSEMAAQLGAQGEAAMASMPMAQSPQMMGAANPTSGWASQLPQLQRPQGMLSSPQQQVDFLSNPSKGLFAMGGFGGGQY